jgi:hypothetical protein
MPKAAELNIDLDAPAHHPPAATASRTVKERGKEPEPPVACRIIWRTSELIIWRTGPEIEDEIVRGRHIRTGFQASDAPLDQRGIL